MDKILVLLEKLILYSEKDFPKFFILVLLGANVYQFYEKDEIKKTHTEQSKQVKEELKSKETYWSNQLDAMQKRLYDNEVEYRTSLKNANTQIIEIYKNIR